MYVTYFNPIIIIRENYNIHYSISFFRGHYSISLFIYINKKLQPMKDETVNMTC